LSSAVAPQSVTRNVCHPKRLSIAGAGSHFGNDFVFVLYAE